MSSLGNVHKLDLPGCDEILDMSNLVGNEYFFNFSSCCGGILDVNRLVNVDTLDLLDCKTITIIIIIIIII